MARAICSEQSTKGTGVAERIRKGSITLEIDATKEFMQLLAGTDPNGLPVIEEHKHCPGHMRHWYTEYGSTGVRLPFCVRCGNPNPRWDAHG